MLETPAGLGQLIAILMMAAALGMDAFSLGIGIGMKGIRLLHVLKISVLIGLFHILMPLIGMYTGQYMSSLLGQVADYVAGGLLILLGVHMVFGSFKSGETRMIDHRSLLGMLLFALSVSVDSFSVGLSLGMFQSNLIVTVLAFGISGGVMSVLGLLLGRRASRNLGDFGEALGGVILLAFGLAFIF
ncbi:manganese efflux pump MntP family protein [Paenibacillus sp. FSL M7-1455]|uniref:manganese efflux pump MntP n=1 Tax=Paenibacillus sp. FSL M7-1455 TaxID=2975316 RepID=UPI0030FAE407